MLIVGRYLIRVLVYIRQQPLSSPTYKRDLSLDTSRTLHPDVYHTSGHNYLYQPDLTSATLITDQPQE